MIIRNVLDMIGNTPIVDLSSSTGCNIYAKAEFLNLGGSIKDRVAKNMIEAAEKEGKLRKGMTIVEPTSGNTGIGLALCGVRMGYKVIIVMPENMSEERKKIIRALGAELVLTPAKLSLDGCVAEATRIVSQSDEYFMPQQFENPNNPDIPDNGRASQGWLFQRGFAVWQLVCHAAFPFLQATLEWSNAPM